MLAAASPCVAGKAVHSSSTMVIVASSWCWMRVAALGREPVRRAVEVRAEGDALLVELPQLGEAHHLEAAGIGEDGAGPVHEPVQPAQPLHPVRAGPEHEVVGVAEDQLRAGRAHGVAGHALDRACRADGHEHGRLDLAMGREQPPGARRAVRGLLLPGERHAARSNRHASP